MVQARVLTGASGQQQVADWFKSQHGANVVSVAKKGSNVTDVVLEIEKVKYGVEVKNTTNLATEVSIFDLSASRQKHNFYYLNELSKAMLVASGNTTGLPKWKNSEFLYGIDWYRLTTGDKTVGFPLDEGVTSRAGKLPPFYRSKNSTVLSTAHKLLMNHFEEKGDSFFTITYKDRIFAWYTGKGTSPIKGIPKLPSSDLNYASLASYGVEYYRQDLPEKGIKKGDLRGVLRTALKIKFNLK